MALRLLPLALIAAVSPVASVRGQASGDQSRDNHSRDARHGHAGSTAAPPRASVSPVAPKCSWASAPELRLVNSQPAASSRQSDAVALYLMTSRLTGRLPLPH